MFLEGCEEEEEKIKGFFIEIFSFSLTWKQFTFYRWNFQPENCRLRRESSTKTHIYFSLLSTTECG
jgi:hypothetical protein